MNRAVLALLASVSFAVWAKAQSGITQNNLLQNGGFDSRQSGWNVSAQGQFFYDDAADSIASIGWVNDDRVWQTSATLLDTNENLVLTARVRNGDGHLEGVHLVLYDARARGTVLNSMDFWFPSSDAFIEPASWRVYSLFLDTRDWANLAGHNISVAVQVRDTSTWGQYGWLHVDWVQLAPASPRFKSQPENVSSYPQASVTFMANAVGAVMTNGPLDLRYQWYKAPDTPLPNATNASLTFPNLSFEDAGAYFVVVSNLYGVAQSSNATLTVRPPDGPSYDAYIDPTTAYVTDFEGWGTSLCWWAHVVGGFANRTTYADLAFTQLKLNIVRYNIGGGENPGIPNTLDFRARVPGFQPSPGTWDWTADANQRWMLNAAVARGADRVVAFANSPPWWMTVSGSVTGSNDGVSDNLLTTAEANFAAYLATVVSNLTVLDGITFDFVAPINEPNSTWWQLGGRQEGCPMSAAQQARVINQLAEELASRGLSAGIVGPEDADPQLSINSLDGYDAQARSNLRLVATHTYGAINGIGLRTLAQSLGKTLWMSEYGDSDGSGLTMARRIRDDLAVMRARAWAYWQVVDNAGGWGLLVNRLDGNGDSSYVVNPKFYVLGQFSQFIRPGCQLLSVNDANSLAAYTASNQTLVIVAVNDTFGDFSVDYDLSGFAALPAQAARHRTSPVENLASLPALELAGTQLLCYLPARSVTTLVLTNAVRVARPAEPKVVISSPGDNSVNLTVTGDSGPDYILETSSNLSAPVMWMPIITNFSATPPFQWTVTLSSNQWESFYRVRLLP